jgi:hypothetical protein
MSLRFTAALATVALAAGATSAFAHDGSGQRRDGRHDDTVLQAAMFGSQPAGPVLFGVKPGGAPWVIDEGEATVRRDGRVEASVEGLVIPTPPQNGTNPLTGIAATVYCGGVAVGTTRTAPFSSQGDASIEDTLATALPTPCLAPAVLLNPAPGGKANTGVYIAATGA